jgi:hypothetical protein
MISLGSSRAELGCEKKDKILKFCKNFDEKQFLKIVLAANREKLKGCYKQHKYYLACGPPIPNMN